jgi:TorA maturation chaperone TorD
MSAVLAEIPTVELTSPSLARLRTAASEDLLMLALLHDRELDRELIHALWRDCYEDFLGLRLQGPRAARALALLREGLTEIPTELRQATLDWLAADYADIYLTYGLRASPCESVWLDDDNLTLQEPTFQVRAWYRRYGLAVTDWRKRSDDHLVYQLRFLAHLLDGEGELVDLTEVARFMDEHPLRWISQFAERVAGRCGTQFYAGLALLTSAYLEELRDLLAQVTGTPRPAPEELAAPLESVRRPLEVEGPFLPGGAPSW